MNRRIILAVLAVLVLGGLFLTLRPEPAVAPQDRTIDVSIEGSTMTPSRIEVLEGSTVTLRVRSDREIELHLHGVDQELEVGPKEPETLEFQADTTGDFPIEDHGTEEELGRLVISPREGG